MLDEATYRLISSESELAGPATLYEGSLAGCLDELKEAILLDVFARDRRTLTISAISNNGDDASTIEVMTARTTGQGY